MILGSVDNDYREKHLKCHWNTPIYEDGYVYGCSGRHEEEAVVRCIEFATGRIAWQEKILQRCSFTGIDGHLLCLTEHGKLLLLKVNPKKFDKVAEWDTNLDYPTWAAPVVARGLLYLRGKDKLICVELIPQK